MLAASLPAPRYQATTVVSVQPANDSVSTQLLDYLLPSLQARIGALSLYTDVADSLSSSLREAEWTVDTSVPAGSGVMYITVTSEERQLPVAAANAYARLLGTQDLGTDALEVVVVDQAVQIDRVSGRTAILASGFGLAVIAASLVALARAAASASPAAISAQPATEPSDPVEEAGTTDPEETPDDARMAAAPNSGGSPRL